LINTSKIFPFIFSINYLGYFFLELAEQFSRYDNDDGRSSRRYQNMNDEEYFNQLRHEFCSQCKN
jgi:hypothetical protein